MPVSMYQASVPVFVEGLSTLAHLLQKGEAHALETGADPATLVEARLAPDMLTLAGQVQRASDTSKLSLERLTGIPAPKLEDNEKTFADLYVRIDRTKAYLGNFGKLNWTAPKRVQFNSNCATSLRRSPARRIFSRSRCRISFFTSRPPTTS